MSRTANNNLIESLLGGAARTQSGWRLSCPFCEQDGHRDRKTSLQVLGDGRWWCWRCSTKGKMREAPDPTFIAQSVLRHVQDPQGPKTFSPPPYFVELADDTSHVLAPARSYLASRHVSPETMRKLGLGACYDGRWAGRIIVPVKTDREGEKVWWGWIGRLWRTPPKDAQGLGGMKYLYPAGMSRGQIVYNGSVLLKETDVPAMLVEGAFDTFPFRDRAFAVLGKLSHNHKTQIGSRTKRPIAVVLDGDAWREGLAAAQSLQLGGVPAGAVRLPPCKDPDEVNAADLLEACRVCIGARGIVSL